MSERDATQPEPMEPMGHIRRDVDVLIIGGGLAGLALARQLLLRSDKQVLLVDRRALPPTKQKVGEATVQMSGYYYARVLEMEEHLLCEHYMKYNLRFYWKHSAGGERYEDLDQSYIRNLSNIVTYQLDRNVFEAELLRVNLESPRFELHAPAAGLEVDLADGAAGDISGTSGTVAAGDSSRHRFRFRSGEAEVAGTAAWVVDASGRGRYLARRQGLITQSPIRHGATWCWVDGLMDVERLTDLDGPAVRRRRDRAALGHVPAFLATNHFCGEGYWFWTIPLHGKTSLGLVYDRSLVPREEVATPAAMIDWVCRQYPMFARDLPRRRVVDWSGFKDFALDSSQTLSAARWAMCGEACRFSDPLYSPGGDLISVYNTLITDAILTEDPAQLAGKVRLYEQVARAVYDSYLPSFAVSYATLGDQETFTLRYVWELTVYFSFFVFPFINDLFTDRQFVPSFLRHFARLGPTNRNLHAFLAAYFEWKKVWLEPVAAGPPRHFDFYQFAHLRAAAECFYQVGLTAEEARPVLAEQLENLEDLARFVVAHVSAAVTGDPRALSREFVEGIDLRRLVFNPAVMAARITAIAGDASPYAWRLQPAAMGPFRQARRAVPEPIDGAGGAATDAVARVAEPEVATLAAAAEQP
ncbi:MAG TPA: FAD-dependent oxidoreductase [Thermoanaerobaculia bacterium]|nr:FAD-dependent oxidoreductase [Thermoanaerobaculia bacterium]